MGRSKIITDLDSSLRLPAFVAPMFLISGPDIVIAAGKAGLIGAFPAPNARTMDDLSNWLQKIEGELSAAGRSGQWAINMIVHKTYDRFDQELELVCQHKPKIVITALGGPQRALDAVHAYGGLVFSDVITPFHARKAVDAGADGLILVCNGAGGHTGSYSPFAFIQEVREFWDGPLIVGGAVSSARGIAAMLMLGADYAYMGTHFISAKESLVTDDNRQMLIRAGMQDIITTAAISGVNGNWMRESLERAGYTDLEALADAKGRLDFSNIQGESKAWKNVWGAGQGVGATKKVKTVERIVEDLARDWKHVAGESVAFMRWESSGA